MVKNKLQEIDFETWTPLKDDRFRPIGSDRHDDFITVMAFVEHWVMFRSPSCVPEVMFIKDFRKKYEFYAGYKG